MFKLTVVGGPSKGSSYPLKDGETSVGRVEGNDIVLSSQRVSKRHLVLVVSNSEVTLKDAGSSNGTFVNGVLTKTKKLASGDRVSVGEFVLELTRVEKAATKAVSTMRQSRQGGMPVGTVTGIEGLGGSLGTVGALNGGLAAPASASVGAAPALPVGPPKDLKEKLKYYFEQYVINFVYNLNETYEWRTMMAAMFVALVVVASVASVYPVMDRVAEKLALEAEGRAFLLARQMVDHNSGFLFERMDSKVDISFIEKERGVVSAYLIDNDGRILAPGRKLNQYVTEPNEAAFSALARQFFLERETREQKTKVYGNVVAVAVPLRIFNPTQGKNVVRALGLVFFDRNLVMFDFGTESMVYIQAILITSIVALIIFVALYRLTLRPLVSLNDGIDQVLKGNGMAVTAKFKMEEIGPLLDVINAALQRVSSSGAGGAGGFVGGDSIGIEDFVSAMRFAGDKTHGAGVMVFSSDHKIKYLNPVMEEVTGIHNDQAIDKDVQDVARDAAFASFVTDVIARAPSAGAAGVTEDFEFSGVTYRLECLAVGDPVSPRGFVLTGVKS